MADETVKVTLDVIMPEGATKEDLKHMCNFLFFGHEGNTEIVSKFDHELYVDGYEIKT